MPSGSVDASWWRSFQLYLKHLFRGWYAVVNAVFFALSLASAFVEDLRPALWLWACILVLAFLVAQFLAFHDVRVQGDLAAARVLTLQASPPEGARRVAEVAFDRFAPVRYGKLTNTGPAADFKIKAELFGGKDDDSEGYVFFSLAKDWDERQVRRVLNGETVPFELTLFGSAADRWSFQLTILSSESGPQPQVFHVRKLPLGLTEVIADGEAWQPRTAAWESAARELIDQLMDTQTALNSLDPNHPGERAQGDAAVEELMTFMRESSWVVGADFIGQRNHRRVQVSEARGGNPTPADQWEADRSTVIGWITQVSDALQGESWG